MGIHAELFGVARASRLDRHGDRRREARGRRVGSSLRRDRGLLLGPAPVLEPEAILIDAVLVADPLELEHAHRLEHLDRAVFRRLDLELVGEPVDLDRDLSRRRVELAEYSDAFTLLAGL